MNTSSYYHSLALGVLMVLDAMGTLFTPEGRARKAYLVVGGSMMLTAAAFFAIGLFTAFVGVGCSFTVAPATYWAIAHRRAYANASGWPKVRMWLRLVLLGGAWALLAWLLVLAVMADKSGVSGSHLLLH